MHWYKRDPHAAIEGMLGLTMEERGAYNTLLDLLYARDGLVPNDDAFMAIAQQCNPRTWRKVRDALIAKGKVRITADGKLTANRVELTLNEARMHSESQANAARMRWERREKHNENNEASMPPGNATGNATTSTSTKKENFLPFSVTTSEQLQPSEELLNHERKKRPTPGSLATAPFDSALTRPAFAAASTTRAPHISDRPFTREEAGKPSGWDWENQQEATEK